MRGWGIKPGGGGGGADPFTPSGSWVAKVGNDFSFSRDGKNWSSVVLGGIANTSYQGDVDAAGDYLFIGVNGGSSVFKSANKSVPDWDGASGGDGIGACQWVAYGASGWVARTTTQLRTSADGTTWFDNDASAPANWSSIGSGQFRYSPTAGLYIACGSTFSTGFLDQYFTSANRLAWTQRTFPANWQSNGQTSPDFFVDNGSIAVMALQDGRIYSTTDCINWTLRFTAGANLGGIIWNPVLGAFYAQFFLNAPDNLRRSTDGITWTAVAGNNLQDFLNSGQMLCDPVTGLMLCNSTSSNAASFQTSDCAVTQDGVTWSARWAKSGRWLQHVPGKYGPIIDETLTITPDPFTAFDAQATPTQSFARFVVQNDGTIDRQTASGGLVQVGKWTAGPEGSLSLAGREYMLTQNSGDALNFGTSPLGVWRSGNLQGLYGYSTTFGVLSGNFTLRVRDKITLVEDTNGGVSVTITVEST